MYSDQSTCIYTLNNWENHAWKQSNTSNIYTHVSPCLEVQNFTSQWKVKKFAKSFARFHIGMNWQIEEYEMD